MVIDHNIIPNYLKAKTPKALRRLMFKESFRIKSQIKFFDIQFVGESWYAWYNILISESDEIREQPLAAEARDGRIV